MAILGESEARTERRLGPRIMSAGGGPRKGQVTIITRLPGRLN